MRVVLRKLSSGGVLVGDAQSLKNGVVERRPHLANLVFSTVGLTRFVSRTMKRPRSGSIQSEVPVKP